MLFANSSSMHEGKTEEDVDEEETCQTRVGTFASLECISHIVTFSMLQRN